MDYLYRARIRSHAVKNKYTTRTIYLNCPHCNFGEEEVIAANGDILELTCYKCNKTWIKKIEEDTEW